MAWPNPFCTPDRNTRTCWNYTFQWTDAHLTREQMHPMKQSYDTLGELALNKLNAISPPPWSSTQANGARHDDTHNGSTVSDSKETKRDLYALLRENAENDEVLRRLWTEVNTAPSWVCWEQVARGQDCFYRYGGPALTGLAFQSLLGGMGATRVVEVLSRTGGFSTRKARKRLFETTQHILQCTQSLDSIKPGGAGHASSVRVRLLHAAVRQRIMKLAKQRPEYYGVEKYGIPINDLDCIATIGTFSATLVWLSLPRQGIWMRYAKIISLAPVTSSAMACNTQECWMIGLCFAEIVADTESYQRARSHRLHCLVPVYWVSHWHANRVLRDARKSENCNGVATIS